MIVEMLTEAPRPCGCHRWIFAFIHPEKEFAIGPLLCDQITGNRLFSRPPGRLNGCFTVRPPNSKLPANGQSPQTIETDENQYEKTVLPSFEPVPCRLRRAGFLRSHWRSKPAGFQAFGDGSERGSLADVLRRSIRHLWQRGAAVRWRSGCGLDRLLLRKNSYSIRENNRLLRKHLHDEKRREEKKHG